MSNYINDIRKINKLINENNKEGLSDFLSKNKVDLNYFEKTTSPLKVAFNNLFKTKDFDILEILIRNNIDIFEENFVFKLLRYNKTSEFAKLYDLRKEEIKNYQRGNKTFLEVLKNFTHDKTIMHVSSIINKESDNDKIYTSLHDVVKDGNRDYLSKNSGDYKSLVTRTLLRSFNYFTYNKSEEDINKLEEFKQLYTFLSEFYSNKDFMKGKQEDNSIVDLCRNFNYFLYKHKKENSFNQTKIFLINILDEFYKDFDINDINYKNRENVRSFFNFQNTLQGYKGRKDIDHKVLEKIEETLNNYKDKKVYYPAYDVIFKENLISGSLKNVKMFGKVNLTKNDIESVLEEYNIESDNKETIKEMKLIMLCSLINDSGIKAHKILHEVMQEKGIYFEKGQVLITNDRHVQKIEEILTGLVENKLSMVPDFLNFIKNKEDYFEHTEDYKNQDFLKIYLSKPSNSVEIKDIKILMELYKNYGVDLKDLSPGTSGEYLFKRGVLQTKKLALFEDYIKINPHLDKYQDLVNGILRNSHVSHYMEKIFEICTKNKFLNKNNFPESILEDAKKRNSSPEMIAYIEKLYMQNIIISDETIENNNNSIIQRKKRM